MKITVVGALAVVVAIVGALLLIHHLNKQNKQESEQSAF